MRFCANAKPPNSRASASKRRVMTLSVSRSSPRYHEENVPGVYISYPFCAQKCTYCNFASGVFPVDWEPRYREALCAEIRAHRWQWIPDTVYLGGGTPSNLVPEALSEILVLVPGSPWLEGTIEAAPGNLTAGLVCAWSAAGINRV